MLLVRHLPKFFLASRLNAALVGDLFRQIVSQGSREKNARSLLTPYE